LAEISRKRGAGLVAFVENLLGYKIALFLIITGRNIKQDKT